MSTLHNLLKGMPVLVLRKGLFPNKADIQDVQRSWPGATVRTEVIHHPATRFVVTVRNR